MENDNATTCDCYINTSRYFFSALSSQFPQLAVQMFDMWFMKQLETNSLHHLQKPNQPCLQLRRKGCYLIVNEG